MQSGPYCRINHILKLEGITEREFARGSGDIGFVFPIVYDFAKKNPGNPRILHQWIQAVINRFPKYSEDWILNGEGEMLKDILPISAGKSFPQKADRNVDMQDVPLYDFDATAGLMALFNDRQVEAADFLRIPNLPPVDGAVYVRGESMTPLLKSGDIVIYKKKAVAIDSILWGEIYLLSFDCDGDSYTAVKYIQKSEDPTKVRLVSFNPSFAPKDIPMESITALALVKASITFHTME